MIKIFIFLICLIEFGKIIGNIESKNEETLKIHHEMTFDLHPEETSDLQHKNALDLDHIHSPDIQERTSFVQHERTFENHHERTPNSKESFHRVPWQYVGSACCNISTTAKCRNLGGHCQPLNESCYGQAYPGSEYCDINHLNGCKCCVPQDIIDARNQFTNAGCHTLQYCQLLNGTCARTCEGRSVSAVGFCADSDHCKCCLPDIKERGKEDCPCGQDQDGGCRGYHSSGVLIWGICEKSCRIGRATSLLNNTCYMTGNKNCKCCANVLGWSTNDKPRSVTTTTSTPRTTTISWCDARRTTICPDGSRCHSEAKCIPKGSEYTCKCNVGYAGDGADCGPDVDIDSWPDSDLTCCEVQVHCNADNCPAKPNSGQEDSDCDGIGDACDTAVNPTGDCEMLTDDNFHECQDLSDPTKTTDYDGDGHYDFFDNCPNIYNIDQIDDDSDGVGNECDTDLDADRDGFQDGIDNCKHTVNPEQSDVDGDGIGDECDKDADDDGIYNINDNCWLVPNHNQGDYNSNGIGDACEEDFDGDGCLDYLDVCPSNTRINRVDFRNFKNVTLGKIKTRPVWIITHGGKEITQKLNAGAAYMYGIHSFSGVDYEGTLFIDSKAGDNDNVGFIFGYQSSKKFYAVIWNANSTYGLQLKKVNSLVTPHTLWDAVSDEKVQILWKQEDSRFIEWDYDTSYRWQLIHRPKIGLIRFRFLTGSTIISDSPNIFDDDIIGGRVGVFCESQPGITWSGLEYSCNDESVPQEVYDSLPPDKRSKLEINQRKSWAGTPP